MSPSRSMLPSRSICVGSHRAWLLCARLTLAGLALARGRSLQGRHAYFSLQEAWCGRGWSPAALQQAVPVEGFALTALLQPCRPEWWGWLQPFDPPTHAHKTSVLPRHTPRAQQDSYMGQRAPWAAAMCSSFRRARQEQRVSLARHVGRGCF